MIDYEKLAAGIVWQAVKDYDWALAPIAPGGSHKGVRRSRAMMRRDVESYLGSKLYYLHTNIDPGIIRHRAAVKKRARVIQNFDRLVMKDRKPAREKLETWQKKAVNKARARRCLKPLYYFRPGQ